MGVFLYQLGGLVVHDAGEVYLPPTGASGTHAALGAHHLVFAPGAADLDVMSSLETASVSVRTPAGQASFDWSYNHSLRQFECSLVVPIGLPHPAELRVPLPTSPGSANAHVVTLYDLDLGHTAQLPILGDNITATSQELPAGVVGAFVRASGMKTDAVVQLGAGEYRLRLGC
jgi:hypothetical protein